MAELHRTLLPYHACRGLLGYATKAEYDVEMLELLGSERFLRPLESELRSAVQDERRSPEPGLGFLKNFAASQLEIQPALASLPTDFEASPARSAPEPEVSAAAASRPSPADSPASEASEGAMVVESDACWQCGSQLPSRPDLRYCVYCGSDQQRPCCLACGEGLESEWAFCPRCGAGLSEPSGSRE